MQPHDELDEFPPVVLSGRARRVFRLRGTVLFILALVGSASCLRGADRMQAVEAPSPGRWTLSEAGRPVLVYNHGNVQPPDGLLEKVSPGNLKYARPRGDYIHPLYGLDGQELTHDWAVDHPHHRGIYWAWPEVMLGEEMGDLHALQRVFARPVGTPVTRSGEDFSGVEARSRWMWEDTIPIVEETARIRVWRATASGCRIDLEFRFRALTNGVTVARRQTRLYGGLNIRLVAVKQQEIRFHTAPAEVAPRPAWSDLSGGFGEGAAMQGLAIFQHPGNPDHPGDWIQYPEINWVQPTFPAADTRYSIPTAEPLVLRYRLWIHAGRVDDAAPGAEWSRYTSASRADGP